VGAGPNTTSGPWAGLTMKNVRPEDLCPSRVAAIGIRDQMCRLRYASMCTAE
jgi:hypothetical protein